MRSPRASRKRTSWDWLVLSIFGTPPTPSVRVAFWAFSAEPHINAAINTIEDHERSPLRLIITPAAVERQTAGRQRTGKPSLIFQSLGGTGQRRPRGLAY